jgi:hypothetical protein
MGVLTSGALLLLLWVAIATACHPECSWACDDPVCSAVCKPVCQPPVCQVQCDNPDDVSACRKPHCWVRCPADQCESDQCPACETICAPLDCRRNPEAVCEALCEATQCSWWCEKPDDCPKPRCELECERPACESSHPPADKSDDDATTILVLSIVLPLLGAALCIGFLVSLQSGGTANRPTTGTGRRTRQQQLYN